MHAAIPAGYTKIGGGGNAFNGAEGIGNNINEGGNSGNFVGIRRNTSLDDFVFECSSWSGSSTAGFAGAIFFRHSTNNAGYFLTNKKNTGEIRLKKGNFHNNNATGQLGYYDGTNNSSPSIKIQVVGSSIKVWIDGVLRFDVTDATYTTGNFGFHKYQRWDDNHTWTNIVYSAAATVPTITTTAHSAVTCQTALSGGTAIGNGGGTVVNRGICWGTSANPDTTNNLDYGVGEADFGPSAITGLTAGVTYYYRAYAVNESGIGYGDDGTFDALSTVVAGTIGANQSICYSTAPAQLTETGVPTEGNGVYTHQWQSSPDDAVWTDIGSETSNDYQPGVLSVTTYYRREDSSGDCGTTPTGSVQITVGASYDPGVIGF